MGVQAKEGAVTMMKVTMRGEVKTQAMETKTQTKRERLQRRPRKKTFRRTV